MVVGAHAAGMNVGLLGRRLPPWDMYIQVKEASTLQTELELPYMMDPHAIGDQCPTDL